MTEAEVFTNALLAPQAIHGNLAVLTYKCAPHPGGLHCAKQ